MSQALCCHAFETLYSRLNHSTPLPYEKFHPTPVPEEAPLFVTWDKGDQFRGCIGTLSDISVVSGVSRYALVSAFQDSRFSPIQRDELSALSVSVTLLSNFQPLETWDSWTVGKHGLRLQFEIHGNEYSGTFLPHVAKEENWDKQTTLYHLLLKCGYNRVAKDKVVSFYEKGLGEGWMDLTSYEGVKSELDFDEFVVIRKGVE